MDYQTAAALVGGVLAVSVASFIVKWAWTHTHKRIDDLNNAVEKKADNYELERARDAQKDIFNKIDKHDAEDRERHSQILIQMGELKGMMNTLLMRKRGGEG